MSLRVSWSFICIAAWKRLIKTWNKPVVPGTSHVCSDFSWECSWQCQFTNNTPTGLVTNPVTSHEFWLSDTMLVLTISFLTVCLKSWKRTKWITELNHLLKKREGSLPQVCELSHIAIPWKTFLDCLSSSKYGQGMCQRLQPCGITPPLKMIKTKAGESLN